MSVKFVIPRDIDDRRVSEVGAGPWHPIDANVDISGKNDDVGVDRRRGPGLELEMQVRKNADSHAGVVTSAPQTISTILKPLQRRARWTRVSCQKSTIPLVRTVLAVRRAHHGFSASSTLAVSVYIWNRVSLSPRTVHM